MGKHISEELLNMLGSYMVDEIGSRALRGVTYSFVFKPEYLESMNKKRCYVNKKGAETDIENFKYDSKNNGKYRTNRDGFVACIRTAMIYYGGIN